MEGKVEVRIGRVSGSKEYMSIEIIDEASRVVMFKIDMSCEDFTRCITGRCLCDLPAFFGELSKVGKRLECKTIEVVGLGYDNWKSRGGFIAPYEVDGWVAMDEEGINHHHCTNLGYRVSFKRWV